MVLDNSVAILNSRIIRRDDLSVSVDIKKPLYFILLDKVPTLLWCQSSTEIKH